jgi:hypothetical protein
MRPIHALAALPVASVLVGPIISRSRDAVRVRHAVPAGMVLRRSRYDIHSDGLNLSRRSSLASGHHSPSSTGKTRMISALTIISGALALA